MAEMMIEAGKTSIKLRRGGPLFTVSGKAQGAKDSWILSRSAGRGGKREVITLTSDQIEKAAAEIRADYGAVDIILKGNPGQPLNLTMGCRRW